MGRSVAADTATGPVASMGTNPYVSMSDKSPFGAAFLHFESIRDTADGCGTMN
jgi:hypothetical protein